MRLGLCSHPCCYSNVTAGFRAGQEFVEHAQLGVSWDNKS